MSAFTLAHLSDPHIGPLPDLKMRELASKRVLGYVNWRRNRASRLTSAPLDRLMEDLADHPPDHIAVTGDITNLALDAEIDAAAEWLAALGPGRNVSVVPGNHDAYVPGAIAKIRRAWGAFMRSDDHVGQEGASPFPFVRRRGPVAIIGVSSARASGPFFATGHFGPSQAVDLADRLHALGQEGLFRVVLIHHPPKRGSTSWHKRLVGGSRFRAAISGAGAELILHGHTHDPDRTTIPGRDGPVPVIGVPSASAGFNDKHPPARYNLFSISGTPGAWRCDLTERGLDPDSRRLRDLSVTPVACPGAVAA